MLRSLVASGGEFAKPVRIRLATTAVSLRGYRRAYSVFTNLSECNAKPALLRLAVGDPNPAFVNPPSRLVAVKNDAVGHFPAERYFDQPALRHHLDGVEQAAVRLVVPDEQVRLLVLDGDEGAVGTLDDHVGPATEAELRVPQRASGPREPNVRSNSLGRKEDGQVVFACVLVDQ